ncbi:hypothetical protein CR513_20307, partial [Mucuna pruriens]
MDRSMIDAASGGALMYKTLVVARHLISNMASNTQQFGVRGSNLSWRVNEIGATTNQRMENQLAELTSLVRQLPVGQQPTMVAKICGICTSMEHPTDMCLTLQETESDQPENRVPTQGNSPSLEDLMKQLATSNLEFQQPVSSSNMQFQQNVIATIQELKKQIRQLANTVSHIQSAGFSNLTSQTIPNPRGNASVVTLKSGKELPQPTLQQLLISATIDPKPNADPQSRPKRTVSVSFPTWTVSARKLESDEELLKIF